MMNIASKNLQELAKKLEEITLFFNKQNDFNIPSFKQKYDY